MALTFEQFKKLREEGLSSEQIASFEKKEEQPFDFSLKETIKAVPSSAGRMVSDIFSALRHPVQTAKALGTTAIGGVEKLIPGEQKHEEQFENVVEFFKERYGGIENIKKTVQTDPVGFLGDVSALMTGGGAAIKGAGVLSKVQRVSKIGTAVQKAGLATEPLTLAGKSAYIVTKPLRATGGALGREVLGVTTGAGGEIIREAFRNPTPEFKSALRGNTTVDNVLTKAREGLNTLKEQKATSYRISLEKIKTVKKPLTDSLNSFKQTIDEKLKKFNVTIKKSGELDFSKSAIADSAEAKRVSEFIAEIRKWDDATPSGLDILKQRLDDFYSSSGRARALTTGISSDLRQTLNRKIPGYKKMTKDYAETSNLVKEIEKSLSLKPGTSMDTSIRKLASTLRQNNEFRRAMVDKLDELTETNLVSQIAGTALSPGVPSGLIGRSIFAGILGAGIAISPAAFYGILVSSPRIVGEFLRILGLSAKVAESAAEFITSKAGKELLIGGFQVGRIEKETQD